ncbi:MAG: amidohydrolase family protein, partial [Phycisphaerae bacterium]|nr:amidohydrolase family protein [Phycisphaerae bacterium]
MSSVLIKNGRIIDPAGGPAVPVDLFIEDDRIAALGQVPASADITIDAQGLLITPGLIDLHVHFRQPGYEQAETILSGCRAAVCGGFTAVAVMPNTTPCIDTAQMVRLVGENAQQADLCRVHVVGAVTVGRQGRQLADLHAMAQAGALAFSDDGDYLASRELMQQAIAQVAALNLAIIQHCEDPVRGRGDVNAGKVAEAIGLSSSSGQTEAEAFVRDLELLDASPSPCRYHLAHVSSADTVRILSLAASKQLSITAEATPHHLSLTDELCRSLDPLY